MSDPATARVSMLSLLNKAASQNKKDEGRSGMTDKGKGKEKEKEFNAGDTDWVDEPSDKPAQKDLKSKKAAGKPEHILLTAVGGKKVWYDLATSTDETRSARGKGQASAGPELKQLAKDGRIAKYAESGSEDPPKSVSISKFQKVWFDEEIGEEEVVKEEEAQPTKDESRPKRRYYRINQIPNVTRLQNPPLRLTANEQAQAEHDFAKAAVARDKKRDQINKQRAEALVDELTDENGEFLANTIRKLPQWPPKLSDPQLDWISHHAISWSLGNGFCLIPPGGEGRPLVTHAPLSLLPTPFPRRLYQLAKTLQPILNSLYMRVALDDAFLKQVFEGSVNHVDPWQNLLYYYYHQVKRFPASRRALGIFRSDYLLHQPEEGGPLQLKQVEFNTIASSFAGLSEKASTLHRHLNVASHGYFGTHPLLMDEKNFDVPESASAIAASLADSWLHYTNEVGRKNPIILFVVQQGERNIFDQKAIEWVLLHKYRIRVERRTFEELATTQLGVGVRRTDETLYIQTMNRTDKRDLEVAVVYFRAGYTPDEYEEPDLGEKKPVEKPVARPAGRRRGKTTDPSEPMKHINFRIRVLFEKSRAICCPTFALQLAGAKKVQQVLTEPGVLESFLLDADRPDTGFGEGRGWLDEGWVKLIRDTWVDMWPMDRSDMGVEGLKLALTEPERFVLKPQREGGGNNVYRTDIPPLLEELKQAGGINGRAAWERYVLMELIRPPKGLHNWLMKGDDHMRNVEVVSELGVYGTMSYGHLGRIRNRRAGILLRTKASTSDEGGVAIGISSIDSPLLIDEEYVPRPPSPVSEGSDDTGSDFTDEVQNWYVYSEDEDENEEEEKAKDEELAAKKAAETGEKDWHDLDCNCKGCQEEDKDDAQFDWPADVPTAP